MGNSWEQEVVEGNPSFLRDLGPYAYNLCYKGCKHNCNYCNLIIFLNLVIGISAPAGPVPCNIIKLMNIISVLFIMIQQMNKINKFTIEIE